MSKKFLVEILRTSIVIVEVEAETQEEAVRKVENRPDRQQVIESNNFIEVQIKTGNEAENN